MTIMIDWPIFKKLGQISQKTQTNYKYKLRTHHMGCSCPCPKRDHPSHSSHLDSYLNMSTIRKQELLKHNYPRRMTCRVITCIEDHDEHYCRRCLNKNSDHFSTDCQVDLSSSTSGSIPQKFFIKFKNNASSIFVKQAIRKQYEDSDQKIINSNTQRYQEKWKHQNRQKSINLEGNANSRVIFQQRSAYGTFSSNNSTHSRFQTQLKQKYKLN